MAGITALTATLEEILTNWQDCPKLLATMVFRWRCRCHGRLSGALVICVFIPTIWMHALWLHYWNLQSEMYFLPILVGRLARSRAFRRGVCSGLCTSVGGCRRVLLVMYVHVGIYCMTVAFFHNATMDVSSWVKEKRMAV
jgi:hypothetical protein